MKKNYYDAICHRNFLGALFYDKNQRSFLFLQFCSGLPCLALMCFFFYSMKKKNQQTGIFFSYFECAFCFSCAKNFCVQKMKQNERHATDKNRNQWQKNYRRNLFELSIGERLIRISGDWKRGRGRRYFDPSFGQMELKIFSDFDSTLQDLPWTLTCQ